MKICIHDKIFKDNFDSVRYCHLYEQYSFKNHLTVENIAPSTVIRRTWFVI